MSNQSRFAKPLRLWPGVAVAVARRRAVRREGLRARLRGLLARHDVELRRRRRRPAVVAVPEPRALVRAPGRRRADVAAGLGVALAAPARVDEPAVARRVRRPRGLPRARRRGGGRPALSRGPRRATIAGAILLASPGLAAGADRGHQRRPRLELPLALDRDPEERLLAQTAREPAPLPPRGTPRGFAGAGVPSAADSFRAGRCREARPAAAAPVPAPTAAAPTALAGERRPTGPASADPSATASCTASASPPTGRPPRPSSCGAGRSGPAGRPSRCSGGLLYTQEQRGDDEIVSCYE